MAALGPPWVRGLWGATKNLTRDAGTAGLRHAMRVAPGIRRRPSDANWPSPAAWQRLSDEVDFCIVAKFELGRSSQVRTFDHRVAGQIPGPSGTAVGKNLRAQKSLGAYQLLPTASQRLVDLNQGNQFVALRLRQSQLSRKRISFIGQHLQVVGCPRFEAHLG